MKKKIFIIGFFLAVGIGVGFGFMNHFNVQIDNNNLYFKNYDNSIPGINANHASSVAFNGSGDVAYTGDDDPPHDLDGNGLTIGTKNKDGSFTFVNHRRDGDLVGDKAFYSNNGKSVAFDNYGHVAYASINMGNADDPPIVLGTREDNGDYSFKALSSVNIDSNKGIGIAFDGSGDIAYATQNDGFYIGKKQDDGTYLFTAYDIGDKTIQSISMDDEGDVAYASKGKGLYVALIKADGTYPDTFDHYKPSFNDKPESYGVALSEDGENVAYTVQSKKAENNGQDGSLGVGTLQSNGKFGAFQYYGEHGTVPSGFITSAGRAVAFDSKDNIGYATKNYDEAADEGGGLNIGKRHIDDKGKITYSFKAYNNENTKEITNNYGTSVAFDSSGNVGYTSNVGGLSIGLTLNIDIDSNTIMYDKRSDGNYNISFLRLNFSFLLENYFLDNEYVKIAITDNNNNIYAAYFIAKNEEIPIDSISYQQTVVLSYPSELSYTLADISGSNGFKSNENIKITISGGANENNLEITNTYSLTIPSTTSSNKNLALELGLGLGLGVPAILIISGSAIYYYLMKKSKKVK